MITATSKTNNLYFARERVVITWQPNGWPAGVVTGYFHDDGFIIEHVVTFAGGLLSIMTRECLQEACILGLHHLTFKIPKDFVWYNSIVRFARRYNFTKVSDTESESCFRLIL